MLAKPQQPLAIQPPSCWPCSGPEEKPKTNIRVWKVREATGLKVPFGKQGESRAQTQGCLFSCPDCPTGCTLLESTQPRQAPWPQPICCLL